METRREGDGPKMVYETYNNASKAMIYFASWHSGQRIAVNKLIKV